MRLKDIVLPDGHVLVHVGERKWDQITVVMGETDEDATHILLHPDIYRAVPVAVVDEMMAMRQRHAKENTALTTRIKAMPQIRVSVTAE